MCRLASLRACRLVYFRVTRGSRLMRLIGLTLTAVAVVYGSLAYAQSGKEMLQSCQPLQRGMHVDRDKVFLSTGVNVQQCWGFIEAVQEFSILADQDGKTLLGACPDEDTKTVQIVKVFVDYARAHPDRLSLPAADVAYNAMADAFPCK